MLWTQLHEMEQRRHGRATMQKRTKFGDTRSQAATRSPLQRWTIVVSAVLAVVLLAVAIITLQRPPPAPLDLQSGISLPQPRAVPEFALLDQHGRPLTRAALQGRWTLLFAGFTHCPDICPTTLTTLTALAERLQDEGRELQVLFLSLDPERDDPATLAPYLDYFNPDFIGATGDVAEIDALMAALGLAYIQVPTGAETYTIDHSTALALIDPRARVVAYFKPPLRDDALADDLLPVLAGAR
jgi:protein SCO1